MGNILAECCADTAAGTYRPPDVVAEFIAYAEMIRMMPSTATNETFDYGITFLHAPVVGGTVTRFDVRFDKRDNQTYHLEYNRLSRTWLFSPMLPKLGKHLQQHHSIYALLDNLKNARWIHAPHKQDGYFQFSKIRNEHYRPGRGYDKDIHSVLFPPAPPDDTAKLLTDVPLDSSIREAY